LSEGPRARHRVTKKVLITEAALIVGLGLVNPGHAGRSGVAQEGTGWKTASPSSPVAQWIFTILGSRVEMDVKRFGARSSRLCASRRVVACPAYVGGIRAGGAREICTTPRSRSWSALRSCGSWCRESGYGNDGSMLGVGPVACCTGCWRPPETSPPTDRRVTLVRTRIS